MGCCGQGREALKKSQTASQPVTHVSAATSSVYQRSGGTTPAASGIGAAAGGAAGVSGQVVLRYLEHSPVVIQGSSTGRRYEFSAASPKQQVDARDAALLLATPFFRRANA